MNSGILLNSIRDIGVSGNMGFKRRGFRVPTPQHPLKVGAIILS